MTFLCKKEVDVTIYLNNERKLVKMQTSFIYIMHALNNILYY